MWESRRLTTLWASTAPYRDSFTFLHPPLKGHTPNLHCWSVGLLLQRRLFCSPHLCVCVSAWLAQNDVVQKKKDSTYSELYNYHAVVARSSQPRLRSNTHHSKKRAQSSSSSTFRRNTQHSSRGSKITRKLQQQAANRDLLHTSFFRGLFFDPDDRSRKLLRNVRELTRRHIPEDSTLHDQCYKTSNASYAGIVSRMIHYIDNI
jgi:hypothetical protein